MEHGLYYDENGELQCEDACVPEFREMRWLIIPTAIALGLDGLVSLF